MKRLFVIISIIFLFVACDQADLSGDDWDAVNYSEAVDAAPMYKSAGAGRMMNEVSEEQKIIRSANLRYEVNDMDVSLEIIDTLLEKYKGVVQNQRQYSQYDRLNTYLTVRVPAKDFESFVNELLVDDGIRRLDEKNLSAKDVTEQFIDIEARLSTKKEAMARYKVLLQKAQTVSDMITVEEKIRRLQEEIESQEARLKYLSGQVEMSEVHIDIYEIIKTTYVPEKSTGIFPTIFKALHSGLKGIIVVFIWVLRLWPVWIAYIIIRLIVRSRKKDK